MKIFILFIMLFLHIVDDYYLQGVLAKMKQKTWWEENAPDPLYKNDYIVALIEHGFSWTFMVMLPIMIWMIYHNQYSISFYVIVFFINWIMHTWIDHLKANIKNCSLLLDQIIHIYQVMMTWMITFYGLYK